MGRIWSLILYTFCIAWLCLEIYLLITAIITDRSIAVAIDAFGICILIWASFIWGKALLKE